MAFPLRSGDRRSIDLSWNEVTGAVGDSVTVLPIVVAVALRTELSLGTLFLGFAAFQIVWGLRYGLPISVEPMKALAALVIAGGLSVGGFVLAGLLAGVVLLVVGTTDTLSRIDQYVGRPVVRGVQVAVALLLLRTGAELAVGDLRLAAGAAAIAVVAVALGRGRVSALAVLAAGMALAASHVGLPDPSIPVIAPVVPSAAAFGPGTAEALLAQLGMTIGNAAVATSLLLSDYFDADVSADDLATSMGVMNLLAVPLGAMPMCHGSGGIAGKYAFGARTAGANLILGVCYAVAAVFAVGLVAAFPMALLGVVLVIVAVELGRAGLGGDHLALTVGIGVVGLLANVGVAFVVGMVAYGIRDRAA